MTPTEARTLADILMFSSTWSYNLKASEALRSLADQVERQAQALTILDGFKGPPPNKDQWDGICALAQALKEVIAREAT